MHRPRLNVTSRLPFAIGFAAAAVAAAAFVARAADVDPSATPRQPASPVDDPTSALRQFTVASGLKVDLFAAEPDVRNPVALSIDERGRVFVVESDRRRSSVFDIRGHREWLDADFSFRTVRDRADFLRRELVPSNRAAIERLTKGGKGDFRDFNRDGIVDWRDLEVQSERIRLLEDTNADGRADRVSVFADGFTNLVAGVAAGVLARRDEVYFACIPDLWRLGVARGGVQKREPIVSGFGVHIAFGGHDMHGLTFGPDGRLYWSIADRGTDTNLFARLRHPPPGLTPELLADSGCVFRANPDGSDFEVVAWGLRNPQELAFDDAGNLFTADNNGDGGDKARWHHVVDGADHGWRIGWQWLEARAYQPKMGPWNGERLWHLAASNTAAWLLPPLAHIGHGPAGLAFNPGTGLPARFDRHFFLCDFPGHVLAWTNRPSGASFEAGPVANFFGELGPTDLAFHPDGGVLVSDWFKTFDKTDKGRLYRIHDPATDASPAVRTTRRLLAEGMAGRPEPELTALLAHADERVRADAQWELARRVRVPGVRSPAIVQALKLVARDPRQPVSARLHALWALGQALAGLAPEAMESLVTGQDQRAARPGNADGPGAESDLLAAAEPAVRAVAWSVLGRALDVAPAAFEPMRTRLLPRLAAETAPRVRAELLATLGRMARHAAGSDAVAPVTDALLRAVEGGPADSAAVDPYLQHAAVYALAQAAHRPSLHRAATHPSPAVRQATLLALRRLADPGITKFLGDSDPRLVLESARAIHDVPIAAAYPSLAALAESEPLVLGEDRRFAGPHEELRGFTLRRALIANFRLGESAHARVLARIAGQTNVARPLRLEALELLAQWSRPPGRDPVLGLWRPLPPRAAPPAAEALAPSLARLLRDPAPEIAVATFRAARALEAPIPDGGSFALAVDSTRPSELRIEALQALADQRDGRLTEALTAARSASDESLRVAATRLQAGRMDVAQLTRALAEGTIAEQQSALAALSGATGRSGLDLLTRQLDALLGGTLRRELILDVLEASARRSAQDTALRQRLIRYTNSLSKDDALAAWRPTLAGGHPAGGRFTFYENQQIACFRCHKLHGNGGDVGPDLTDVVARKGREYLLESIVFPNKSIAPGYESALITMKNGNEFAGLIKSETDSELELNSPEDGLMRLKKADIAERRRSLSAMPEDLINAISRRELRDLIEFLATATAHAAGAPTNAAPPAPGTPSPSR